MNVKLDDIAYMQLGELDSDLFDKTLNSNCTLKLAGSTDAFSAADLISSNKATTIVVTDDNDRVQGVVFPNWLQTQLLTVRGIKTESFADALSRIKQEGDEIAEGTGQAPSYHHEWLNYERPVLYWCDAGEHYIDSETCPYHRP